MANDKIDSGEALPERSDRECDDKEETRRVSDAANDKMESGEALPERSDRECDETEVPGAGPPDVPLCDIYHSFILIHRHFLDHTGVGGAGALAHGLPFLLIARGTESFEAIGGLLQHRRVRAQRHSGNERVAVLPRA